MGNSTSINDTSSKWKTNVTIQKGLTILEYTLVSNSDTIIKKVTDKFSSISFTVDPTNLQMQHDNTTQCGSDGDIDDLKIAVKSMIEKLNLLLVNEVHKEEINNEIEVKSEEVKIEEEVKVKSEEEVKVTIEEEVNIINKDL